MDRTLIHPRLQANVRLRFYPSVCAIQQQATGQDDHGQPVNTWSNVLVGLACRVMPTGGSEPRQPHQTITIGTHRIALDSFQPTITTAMRALVEDVAYNILAVEHDSERLNTYLNVELVT